MSGVLAADPVWQARRVPLLAVAALGPDRPGVVAALTRVLLGRSGNLEDASMHQLSGQFAMTLVVDVPADVDAVRAELEPVGRELGLLISVREVAGSVAKAPAESFVVSVHGADRPGIVHRVAEAIASAGGNITDLSTRLAGDLYVLVAEVDLASDPAPLADALAEIGAQLGVDAHLRPADPDLL
jgi:glycine cleavage system transcriptional repressor